MPRRDLPPFRDLRDFLAHLEPRTELVRIRHPVSAAHEIAEIHRRVVQRNGPALLFEQVTKADGTPSTMPVLVNLFGTVERVAWGLGVRPEPAAQPVVQRGEAVDLGALPAQICWPGEPAPPITWPVVITRPPESEAAEHCNLGV